MNDITDWLLGNEPWTHLRTRIDILGQNEDEDDVLQAKQECLNHPLIRQNIDALSGFLSEAINNHKKAGLWYHRLSFLAEIGLKAEDDPALKSVCEKLLENISDTGVINVMLNYPKVFGGTGEDMLALTLCDTPLVMYCMAKMGYAKEMKQGTEHLADTVRDNGWPCKGSPQLGKFHGPGKREQSCPYATLLMLKLITQYDDMIGSDAAKKGADSLLGLWEHSRELRPFMFRMGTDFRKLKAPFVWLDILHVADVLSQFKCVLEDERFSDMISIIAAKADENGLYKPESVWMAYKGFDFAQKKQPSSWITFLILRILDRAKKDTAAMSGKLA